ncbi:hypothetical protein [uncultured Duncaniella sp.]|uniref:hypothetical protein n=1 Tax=uncultured Duncaniella sp. TaxID=2768039 RepID=UPI00261E40A8|nr:hypothetical protein [uncultured Duncaniella sp.]
MKVRNKQTLVTTYIDFDTPNVSFLKMAALLDAEGVDNCFFFLALKNKNLKGVDPYDPSLDADTMFAIMEECANNRWYFYREVFRVSESGASTEVGGGSPFILNRGNLAYLWAMSLNISAYLIMPRQTGKTWAAIADCTWTHQFVRGSNILHFNKNQSDANMNLRRMQEAISMLPLYLQHSNLDLISPSEKRRVKNNEKTIRNTINATLEAMSSAGNEAKADSMARGKTASKIWWDEFAFIFFNEAMYTASTPAYEKAREVADKNSVPYAISITTTPGDLATPHGAYAYKMMENAIPFTEKMYGYKRDKLFDIIHNTPDKTDFVFIQFSYLQLGEDEDWYLKRAKKMANPLKARREYLLEWINTNGNSPFDPDDLDLIGDMAKQKELGVQEFKINKYYNLRVYSEYHGKKPVIISVDVSGSLGRDSSAVVVVNPESLMPMAVFRSNMIPSNHLKKLLVTLVTKRYPHCILTIENNSVGKPLLEELEETSIARCLYKERKKRQVQIGAANATKTKTQISVELGHNVNPTTRPQMMEILETMVHYSPAHMAIPELYNEILHMELRNGRIDHSSATHDDCTMAYLGALWIVRYGVGLKHKGIYWTITDGEDGSNEFRYDTSDSFYRAHQIVFDRTDESDAGEKELERWLQTDQPVEDSGSLGYRERAEFYKALDRQDGLLDEDDGIDPLDALEQIPDSTQRLMLKSLHSMVGMSGSSSVLDELMGPTFGSEEQQDEDWSSRYSW